MTEVLRNCSVEGVDPTEMYLSLILYLLRITLFMRNSRLIWCLFQQFMLRV